MCTFNPKMEGNRKSTNEILRGHWSEFADGLVDLAANPAFNDPAALTKVNLYIEDRMHLTDRQRNGRPGSNAPGVVGWLD
jgi:hypothetical protein